MDVEQLVGCSRALKESLRDAIGAMVKSERRINFSALDRCIEICTM